MGYNNGAVANIVCNGRPVREISKDDRRVSIIPFDTEYKIRLINKKNVRCKVEVFIDGTDVLFGQKIVLMANQSIDLERFLTDKNDGSKFKFISKGKAMSTGEILDPDGVDNGRIQVKFYEEMPWWATLSGSICVNNSIPSGTIYTNCSTNGVGSGGTFTSNAANIGAMGVAGGAVNAGCTTQANSSQQASYHSHVALDSYQPQVSIKSLNAGVTAEGGMSNQKFSSTSDFNTYAYAFADISIWLSGPLVEEHKVYVAPGKLSQAFVSEAQAKIALGLSAHATKEQRQVAQDYLGILSQAAG